jgi:hypothetical protein
MKTSLDYPSPVCYHQHSNVITPAEDSIMKWETITLRRPIFAKGKDLPKDGVCLANAGDTISVCSENGADWFVKLYYKGKLLKVATILNTL